MGKTIWVQNRFFFIILFLLKTLFYWVILIIAAWLEQNTTSQQIFCPLNPLQLFVCYSGIIMNLIVWISSTIVQAVLCVTELRSCNAVQRLFWFSLWHSTYPECTLGLFYEHVVYLISTTRLDYSVGN